MKPKEFISKLEEERIVNAIGLAERRSSGEIRVWISERKRHNALEAAQARFLSLGMQKTRQRNGVLIYFAPETRQFAIWGDVGVHKKCGEDFWKHIVEGMRPLLKEEKYTDAIEYAIKEVGEVLAKYFPREPGDINELPNNVVRD